MIWDKTDFFIFSKKLILGSLYSLYPVGLSRSQEKKIGSLIAFTKFPLKKSHIEEFYQTPLKLMGLSHFYNPGKILMNLRTGCECDCVNANFL